MKNEKNRQEILDHLTKTLFCGYEDFSQNISNPERYISMEMPLIANATVADILDHLYAARTIILEDLQGIDALMNKLSDYEENEYAAPHLENSISEASNHEMVDGSCYFWLLEPALKAHKSGDHQALARCHDAYEFCEKHNLYGFESPSLPENIGVERFCDQVVEYVHGKREKLSSIFEEAQVKQ